MSDSSLGFVCVKVIALAVTDLERAKRFYGDTLGLPPAPGEETETTFQLGETILMLKTDWYGKPTDAPNPRITLQVENARDMEEQLRARGVVISDPVQVYGEFPVGAFLDSEGNRLWFCSEA